MRFVYPAVFRKKRGGGWSGFFPDLFGCEVEGETLDEAVDRAIEAEYRWLSAEFEEESPELPTISHADDLELKKGDVVRDIGVVYRFFDGWDE